jgi:hypothetical protein
MTRRASPLRIRARFAFVLVLLPVVFLAGLFFSVPHDESPVAMKQWVEGNFWAIFSFFFASAVPAMFAPLLLRCPHCRVRLGSLGLRPSLLARSNTKVRFCPTCGGNLH